MAEALQALGIEPRVILLQVIAFVILFLVLRRFLFKPLMAVMDVRAQEITEGLEAGQRHKESLAHLQEEQARVLAEAREQGREQVRRAVQEADAERERLLTEARAEAQAVREKGRGALELEREQIVLELRQRTVDLALLAASRAVVQQLDETVHRRTVEDFITDLEQSP